MTSSPINPGGKAAVLIELEVNNFPVPTGFAVIMEPQSEDDWRPLLAWWKEKNHCKLAARSSAQGEDGSENSFAGQFLTILQITTENELKAAVKKCFNAVHSKNSLEYTHHFSQKSVNMRVYVQQMIQSDFAGVYFSKDPRGIEKNWLVEVVKGQGEQLVSGQVTPVRFSENKAESYKEHSGFNRWQQVYLENIVNWGKKVENFLNYPVDMEWAIDEHGMFWILQARPITTFAGMTQKRKWLDDELKKINNVYNAEDAWDGQVFAEWTGLPTEMTFSIWKRAFAKGNAFDLSLQQVGYKGMTTSTSTLGMRPSEIINRIFGRCYMNINRLLPIYFGEAPYRIEVYPRPHLKFDFQKVNWKNFLNAPSGWMRMLRVAWNVQTRRLELANETLQKIESYEFSKKSAFEIYSQTQNLTLVEALGLLKKYVNLFTADILQSTFLLTLLIESTYQGILTLLKKDLGDKKANEIGQLVLGQGLSTVTFEMQSEFTRIGLSADLWKEFQTSYGHRGAGELDLSNKRWIEIEKKPGHSLPSGSVSIKSDGNGILSQYTNELGTIRKETLKQEVNQLHLLLQAREKVKMQSMKVYSQIRWLILKVAKEIQVSDADVFWLTLEELFSLAEGRSIFNVNDVVTRREKAKSFMSIDLPQSFSFEKLKKIINGEAINQEMVLQGSNLSSGICRGRIHIVIDPQSENLDCWDEDTILVAEATDPSWTALFARSKGIIVSRGGVLSHCAIVAREMGRPAVGEILGATHLFKEGEYVWVDGTHGLIRRES